VADGPEYEIGYAKPPQGKRFEPGKSGNPKGRPKGAKGLATLASEIMISKVEMMQNGKPKKMSALEAVLHRTKVDAIKGNKAAAERFIRLAERYGPPEPPPIDPATLNVDKSSMNDFLSTLSVFELDILALINAKAEKDADGILESQQIILRNYGQNILDLIGDEVPPLMLPPP